jgi:hypothetical protein
MTRLSSLADALLEAEALDTCHAMLVSSTKIPMSAARRLG